MAGRRAILWSSLMLVAGLLALALYLNVRAAHFTHWVRPGAPWYGQWSLVGHPSTHHHPFGGDWGMDYYQQPDTEGKFYIDSSAGYSSWGTIEALGKACLDPTIFAGEYYRIGVYDSALGRRGWYLVAHFSPYPPTDPWNPWYWSVGTNIYNGATLGWTEYWGGGAGVGSCYQVNYPSSNHWHIEMEQPLHYACYYPPYYSGQWLTAGTILGAIGSNATWFSKPCW